MINHFVFWNFNETVKENEKSEVYEKINELLTNVSKSAKGVISLEVKRNVMTSSNCDIALLSTFESESDLQQYQIHPLHKMAGEYIRTVTCNRTCFDYEQ